MIKRIQKNVMYLHHNKWVKRYIIFHYLGKSVYYYKALDPQTKEWSNLTCKKKNVWVIRMYLYKLTPEQKLELL